MEIRRLKIYTQNLEAQKDFYTRKFNFQVINQTEKQLELYIGRSILIIEESQQSTPYHLAFNVTKNSVEEMRDFVKSKTELILVNNQEIVHFENWNADSVYFYDADHNLLELICRHRLNFVKNVNFSEKSLRQISEIGLATTNLIDVEKYITNEIPLEVFSRDSDKFLALGDDSGLLILADPNQRKWFPTNDEIQFSKFEALIRTNEEQFELNYENGKVEIHKLYIKHKN